MENLMDMISRDNHPHALIRNLIGTCIYEEKRVMRGRSVKICTACEDKIPKGDPSFSLKFYGWDGDYPDNWLCHICRFEDPKVALLIQEIQAGKWDTNEN